MAGSSATRPRSSSPTCTSNILCLGGGVGGVAPAAAAAVAAATAAADVEGSGGGALLGGGGGERFDALPSRRGGGGGSALRCRQRGCVCLCVRGVRTPRAPPQRAAGAVAVRSGPTPTTGHLHQVRR